MHVSHTFDFLKRIPWGKSFARVPAIAGCHHERPNGRGYPRGLTGDEIPLGARVMAVADIFDALTASDRPYKKAVPLDRALAILNLEVRDGGLDPELVRIFVDAGVYRAIDEPLSY
jgi:HD-GYP domain-containing protein (c-di-GMP phosphodiesterase class II)